MHINGINVRVAITLLLLTSLPALPQGDGGSSVRVMFYNVENLFDIHNDPLTADDDFLPSGVMRWSSSRYWKKINSLYKTIIAAGEWDPPAVVAFCEVENRKVLEDLVGNTGLTAYGYGIAHEESPDPRGIDVALIYRQSIFKVLSCRSFIPGGYSDGAFTSRSVLYVSLAAGTDTLHMMVCHWPSRRGGVLAGDRVRSAIAEMVRAKADSICRQGETGQKLLIAGDFNAAPDDPVMKFLVSPQTGDAPLLVNLAEPLAVKGKGTYRYMGTWEMLDQVVVSSALLHAESGLRTGYDHFSIFSQEFLMRDDPLYPGKSPWPAYRGYRYQGGYSDHLPVILDLLRD